LREVEEDFRRIFSLESKEGILENIDASYSGSVDIETLMTDVQMSIETVDEIKDYLGVQRDIFMATPKGYPVNGRITSAFGKRENPFSKMAGFHAGIDIAASPGTGILATADGVVSYSGWSRYSGYVVILEHGLGFSTVYAHNKKNSVKVGERVARGDTVGLVGSTGRSTGPHVHYEVWENGNRVDPLEYCQEGA
jgi:murein DD-endopeptidase MepM/ murein hydrolase activator NlpD